MTLRTRVLGIALLGVAAIQVVFAWSPHSTGQSTLEACTVTVSGADQAYMLPPGRVWEAVFVGQRGAPVGSPSLLVLSAALRADLLSRSDSALEKVRALRQGLRVDVRPNDRAQRERDLVIADTILDARDETLRRASPMDFESVLDLGEAAARQGSFTVPVLGRIVTADQHRRCEVRLSGADFPDLVPEYRLWAASFKLWARAANDSRDASGLVTDDYVRIAQRSGLHAEAPDVRHFLDVASQTADELALLNREHSGDSPEQIQTHEFRLQRTVMQARRRVMLGVSREGWQAIVNRVESTRAGTTVWFRSDVLDQ